MAAVIEDPTALGLLNQHQKDLLDTVDDLRSLGVGRIVDLPQIIVVGDQSSGKSSVLEAISLIRFPVKGGLCTRFATELVLRNSQTTRFRVSITAGDFSDADETGDQDSVKQFNEAKWDTTDLGTVIEEAKKAIGIGKGEREFSELILRIEISRPEVPSLTLIDLPGFYHGGTADQSLDGTKTVNKLAKRYMERKNSIILATITGSIGLAGQIVLTEAKKLDPGKDHPNQTRNPERTLGILTKPDTIPQGTDDENKYIEVVQNEEAANKLDLGWHVLRNRAGNEADLSNDDRDAREAEFLNQGVWRSIKPGDKGIKSLRSKLSRILVDHIKKSLPRVREEIERKIDETRRNLTGLGSPRSSPEQIRQYLGEISGHVLRLSSDAVRGTGYNDPFFGDLTTQWSREGGVFTNARRLRAVVRNLNQTFAAVMKVKGETRSIDWDTEEDGDDVEIVLQSLSQKQLALFREYEVATPTPVKISKLEDEMHSLALEYQGSQFPGSPNDYLAVQLFKNQSQKWGDIAKQHLLLISAAAKSFAEAVVGHVVGADDKTREAILVEIVDPFFQSQELKIEEKLRELLHHYKMGIPQPPDDVFQDELYSKATGRLRERVRSALEMKDQAPFDEAVIEAVEYRTNEYTKVIDIMSAYYKLSLGTFTENVRILAAENCLVSVIPDILTPDKVNRMDDDQLVSLAAESDEIKKYREHLSGQLEILKQGLEKCRKYGARQSNLSPGHPSTAQPKPHDPTPPGQPRATSSALGQPSAGSPGPTAQGSSLFSQQAPQGPSLFAPRAVPQVWPPQGQGLFGQQHATPQAPQDRTTSLFGNLGQFGQSPATSSSAQPFNFGPAR